MRFAGPLKTEVSKIHSGMYQYRGIYLRFNRMQGRGVKWTAHYKKADKVLYSIARSDSLRGLINSVDVVYVDLANGCKVYGFFNTDT